MADEKVKIGVALTVGLCVGGGIGGYVGYRLAERKIRAQATQEVAKIQDLYKRLRREDAEQAREDWNPTPVDAEDDGDVDTEEGVEELEQTVNDLGYVASDDYTPAKREPQYITPELRFPSDQGHPDYDGPLDPEEVDEDLRKEVEYVNSIRIHNPNRDGDPDDVTQWERDPNHPYVITEAEFRLDRPEFEKITLTYYAGDDTLAENDGSYIPDQDGTAGNDNLHNYFGLASGDENLLHVRNERVMCDFEITRDSDSFQRAVLGFNIEDKMLQQSKKIVIRKMRDSE
jgi:hypothetical protein